ncbi:MAG: transglycosylase domain-containing protein, partial [Prevotellaceae bacterium]|nr:transglycosylase domain-containing protein [Prevotellaceae bacterium]
MLLLKNKLGVFYYVHLAISKLLSVALCLLLTGVLSAGFIAYALRTVPVSITPLMMLNQSRKKAPPQKRWVPIDKVSSNIIHAVIASEDNNFFYHNGFDV